jgi:ADP-ribose pyrophosphatase YjhB (NUDIX family)
MYHLKALMREKLVTKTESGKYTLTAAGKDYAERMSLTLMKPRFQPRVVTMLVISNDAGQYLLFRRARQPLFGLIGFPYGKIHRGEKIAAAAARELADKSGLTTPLRHVGDGYIVVDEKGETISQILFHMFTGHCEGAPQSTPIDGIGSVGDAYWGNIEDVTLSELIPSVPDLLHLSKQPNKERFFAELHYDT